jgi:hypothetical protein
MGFKLQVFGILACNRLMLEKIISLSLYKNLETCNLKPVTIRELNSLIFFL